MAKKITIDFSDQPITTGVGFNYSIQISGYDLFYNNGGTECKIDFIPNGDTAENINELSIGVNLAETLQITLSHLRQNFANNLITYNIVNNTIEATVNADATVTVDEDINDNIEITTEEIEPFEINLIYYLIFGNYTLNIYKENFSGNSTEIHGSFTLKKANVDTILEPIRGTGLQLSLEANPNLTFDEFLLNDEFTYKTELLKNNSLVFKGYIKPDGCQQSFVNNEWLINIESVDGLGLLNDLSFVKDNGTHFTGKMSVYDAIKGCLDRTRLDMTINTSIGLEYNGYTGTNILKDIYVNSSRFIKDKDDTVIMNCNEVLTSMLNLFSAIITQQDGQWWILRPNDLILNGYTEFINQTTNTVFTKNLNASLGSQINNFYPHHCDSNQQIEVKGAISAYRLNYQYGFLDGFILNSGLNHNEDLVYDGWTVNPSLPLNISINDPLDLSGVLMNSTTIPFSFALTEVLTSDETFVLEGTVLTFRTNVTSFYSSKKFSFKIKTNDGYFLDKNNNWVFGETDNTHIEVLCGSLFNHSVSFASFELLMPPVLNDCSISVVICSPYAFIPNLNSLTEITYIEILDNSLQTSGIVGENHTVSRILPPSSITKENQKVFNGDGGSILIGSIYRSDLTTPTNLWTRKDKFESLPLLGISAMDDLRIQSNPVKIFSGNIFGEIPYLSVVTIDNIIGLFMFIDYDYDYKSNISQVKLMQFYNSDLGDISYEISPDYGNTIKPTIRG